MLFGNFGFAFICYAFHGDNRGPVDTVIQRPDKIRLAPHAAVIPSGIDEIGPDIPQHIDPDGRVDRDKRAVFTNRFSSIGIGRRPHLDPGAHVDKVIQFSGTHDQARGAVSQVGLLFAIGDNAFFLQKHQTIAIELGLNPQVFVAAIFDGANDGIRNFTDADLEGDPVVNKMIGDQFSDSFFFRG